MTTTRRSVGAALGLIVCIALLHAAVFVIYERADWSDAGVFSDQVEYEELARNLVHQGRYTSFGSVTPTVPEAKRPPGYPLFLAAIYEVAGEGRMAVVTVQAVLFAGLCLLLYKVGAGIQGPALGLAGAAATALYPPLPYYGAQALSMVLATVVMIGAEWLLFPRPEPPTTRRFVFAGLLCGYLALVRPAFILLPLWMVVWFAFVAPRLGGARVRWRAIGGFVAVGVLVMSPWLAYTAVNFGSLSPAPAGRVWRDLWDGTWHGLWPGRVHAQIMAVGRAGLTGEARDEQLRRLGPDVARMRRYLDEEAAIVEPIRGITDPRARSLAMVAAERQYRAAALRHIAEDPLGYVWRRATHGMFILWASHVPIRYRLIDTIPPVVLRAIWALQVLLLAAAAWGAVVLWRSDRLVTGFLLVPVLYVAAIHFPLRPDPRWALPAMPTVLLFAANGVLSLRRGSAPAAIPGMRSASWRA